MKRPKLKKASKRMTCRMKYKIDRKVREHNRKKKKESKVKGKSVKRRDPGVPNAAPFKEEVLRTAELRRQRLEEEKERQKEQRREMFNKQRDLKLKAHDLSSLQRDILKRQKEFDKKAIHDPGHEKDNQQNRNLENSRKAYYREFKKVVESADVVLEVLDARDPLGCRCAEVEQTVLSSGSNKRVVLVLNKIDLVPKENVEAWLKYLRSDFPTVAFKASTQSQRQKLSQNRLPVREMNKDLLTNSSRCLGADNLLKILGNYCRNLDIKTSITVGVVGYPNVGKSSLINSLKRAKACNVGATPGVTKSVQPVTIDKHVKILDCPGIVMASGNEAATILRNCVKVENLQDPSVPVDALLRRCNKEQMMMRYNISNYDDTNEFLSLLARKQGRLKKGGVPDVNKSAKRVLQDWNSGRISYYTHPPEEKSRKCHVAAEIVQEMAKEFDWDSLSSGNLATLESVSGNPSISGGVLFESMGPTTMDASDEEIDPEEEEEMEESEGELGTITVQAKPKTRSRSVKTEEKVEKKSAIRYVPCDADAIETSGSNIQANRNLKGEMKKNKKKKRRADALSQQLGDSLLSAMDLSAEPANGEDYDFDADYALKS